MRQHGRDFVQDTDRELRFSGGFSVIPIRPFAIATSARDIVAAVE